MNQSPMGAESISSSRKTKWMQLGGLLQKNLYQLYESSKAEE